MGCEKTKALAYAARSSSCSIGKQKEYKSRFIEYVVFLFPTRASIGGMGFLLDTWKMEAAMKSTFAPAALAIGQMSKAMQSEPQAAQPCSASPQR